MADFCMSCMDAEHLCYLDKGHEGPHVCGLCDTFDTHDICAHALPKADCVECSGKYADPYLAACYSCGGGSWGWFDKGTCLRCKKHGMEWFCNYTLPDGSEPCFEAVAKWSNDKLTGFCKNHAEDM